MNSRQIGVASLILLGLGTACSKQSREPQSDQSESAQTAPDIGPGAAPGVAFTYNYQFSLPDKQIGAAQETQASACEKLGLAQCRITGMSYDVDESGEVTAGLDLSLNSTIARAFGKSAQHAVEGSDGKLVRLEIGSSDEGAAIRQTTRQQSDSSSQIAQLRQELSRAEPGSQARANLLAQLQGFEQQSAEQNRAIEASQDAIAMTPMAFRYYGRGGVPGFHGNPVHAAWLTFVTTIVWLVGAILQGLAVLVPLLLLAAMLIGLWRTRAMRVVRLWLRGPREVEA